MFTFYGIVSKRTHKTDIYMHIYLVYIRYTEHLYISLCIVLFCYFWTRFMSQNRPARPYAVIGAIQSTSYMCISGYTYIIYVCICLLRRLREPDSQWEWLIYGYYNFDSNSPKTSALSIFDIFSFAASIINLDGYGCCIFFLSISFWIPKLLQEKKRKQLPEQRIVYTL